MTGSAAKLIDSLARSGGPVVAVACGLYTSASRPTTAAIIAGRRLFQMSCFSLPMDAVGGGLIRCFLRWPTVVFITVSPWCSTPGVDADVDEVLAELLRSTSLEGHRHAERRLEVSGCPAAPSALVVRCSSLSNTGADRAGWGGSRPRMSSSSLHARGTSWMSERSQDGVEQGARASPCGCALCDQLLGRVSRLPFEDQLPSCGRRPPKPRREGPRACFFAGGLGTSPDHLDRGSYFVCDGVALHRPS